MKSFLVTALLIGSVSAQARPALSSKRFYEIPRYSKSTQEHKFLSLFSNFQWSLQAMEAEKAWELSDQGSQARVLVIDTGVMVNHPSLKSNIEEVRNFVPNPTTGIIDPLDVAERIEHGTHMAGIIAGVSSPSLKFSGVAPKAKLLVARVCGSKNCDSEAVLKAIEWGISKGVDIINISLGDKTPPTDAELAAYEKAEKAGILVVAASGNGYKPSTSVGNVYYPAKLDTVLAVGGIHHLLDRMSMSSYGPELDIVAPGDSILSTTFYSPGAKTEFQSSKGSKVIRSQQLLGRGASYNHFRLPFPKNTEVVFVNEGRAEDYAKVDVKGKIVILKMEFANLRDHGKECVAAGAAGAYFVQGWEGKMHPPHMSFTAIRLQEGQTFQGAVLEKTQGQEIIDLILSGEKVILTSSESDEQFPDFVSLNGTSMATSNVSGVAALAVSALRLSKPDAKISAQELRDLLKNMATKLPNNLNNELGAGLVQANEAVKAAIDLKN